MFNEYPYVNLQDVNLDWILKHIKDLETNLQDFIKLNTIKYADPIDWNISKQYEANTVVVNDFTGVAYLSTQPVPSGVDVTNTDYWTPIFTLDFVNMNKNITLRNDGNNNNATFASAVGDWLIVGGQLYKVIQDISLHTAYVVGYNIEIYSVEMFVRDYFNQILTLVGNLDDLTTSDRTSIVNAINSVLSDINTTIGDLDDLTTTDKSSLVNAINAIVNEINTLISDKVYITPEMYGAIGDGVTDDTTAMQNAINGAISQNKTLALRNRYLTDDVTITGNITIFGGELIAPLNEYNQTKRILHSSASDININFINVKFNGSATQRVTQTYNLINMIRIENANSVSFTGCEFFNHAQDDSNTDIDDVHLRNIDMINCVDCNDVIFDKCYFHDNHTEQVCVGSVPEKTNLKVINCYSDNNSDGYALFIPCNLQSGIFSNNTFKNNKRTFINMLSSNLIIDGNILDTCESRVIASEGWSQNVRLKNVRISNNLIRNGVQGGIDNGVHHCSVVNNVIENCKEYAINFSGKVSGNDPQYDTTDWLPWISNTLENSNGILCSGNEIRTISNSGQNRPCAILIRGETNITNGVHTYAHVNSVIISDNIVDIDSLHPYAQALQFFYMNNLNDITVKGNYFKNYTYAAIMLGYTSQLITSIENIEIAFNTFSTIALTNYTIVNETTPYINNLNVHDNICKYPPVRALFASRQTNALNNCIVHDNNCAGGVEILNSYSMTVHGDLPLRPKRFIVPDIDSLPSGLNLNIYDQIFDSNGVSGQNYFLVCKNLGTTGTLSGVTGSGTSGNNEIVVNDSSNLDKGNYIIVDGRAYQIHHKYNNTIYLTSDLMTTFNNAVINYNNPTLLKGLQLS